MMSSFTSIFVFVYGVGRRYDLRLLIHEKSARMLHHGASTPRLITICAAFSRIHHPFLVLRDATDGVHNLDDGHERRSLPWIGMPALLHQIGHLLASSAVVRFHEDPRRTQLHFSRGSMRPSDRVPQGHQPLENLVHDNRKTVHVSLQAVKLVPEYLRRHVFVRPCLASHQESVRVQL